MSEVTTKMTQEWKDYFISLFKNGLMKMEDNNLSMQPIALEMIKAVHEILAGGDVTVNIHKRGNEDIKNDLESQLTTALKSTVDLPIDSIYTGEGI